MLNLQPLIDLIMRQVAAAGPTNTLLRFKSFKFIVSVLAIVSAMVVAKEFPPETAKPLYAVITTICLGLIGATAHEDASKTKTGGQIATAVAAIAAAQKSGQLMLPDPTVAASPMIIPPTPAPPPEDPETIQVVHSFPPAIIPTKKG